VGIPIYGSGRGIISVIPIMNDFEMEVTALEGFLYETHFFALPRAMRLARAIGPILRQLTPHPIVPVCIRIIDLEFLHYMFLNDHLSALPSLPRPTVGAVQQSASIAFLERETPLERCALKARLELKHLPL
jgi:hypothetical protein